MKRGTSRHSKDTAILTTVAESIGTALGTIAAKANAAQKALVRSSAVHAFERNGKKIVRKTKRVARKTSRAGASLGKSKAAKAARRGVRRATSSLRRAARRR